MKRTPPHNVRRSPHDPALPGNRPAHRENLQAIHIMTMVMPSAGSHAEQSCRLQRGVGGCGAGLRHLLVSGTK